jgi:uncharacterized membrane protein YfcA
MSPEVAAALTYAGLGLVVGFFSGLLGIGGGSMIVPILGLTLVAFGFSPEVVMHLSLGTSLAVILLATASSMREHHRHGAVRWDLVKALSPGIVTAALGAGFLARALPLAFLKVFFTLFMVYVTYQIAFGLKTTQSRPLPGKLGLFSMGALIGGASGLAGVGGAMLSVPFLAWCAVPFQVAIGTSAAIGFVVAAAGTLGYIVAGLSDPAVPGGAIGYVYLPAWIGISVTSVIAAPFGARLTHRLPVATLKKVFAVFILALTLKLALAL